ncbi:unnamed protein product [Echinostoma caproni]|uniref:Methylcytosine dioxygenase n=1 Tax=Echinostoma caproni TaxID=27848 RepID=A0A183A694_9TREM|nr:unnamed protein product [Echinostoma caproni]
MFRLSVQLCVLTVLIGKYLEVKSPIGKLPVGQGHFSAVPTFGQDYSKGVRGKPETAQLNSGKLVKANSPKTSVTTYGPYPPENRGYADLWQRDHSSGGRGPSPAVLHRQPTFDGHRRPKSIEPDPNSHSSVSWMRPESRSGSAEGEHLRRTGYPTQSNEGEHTRNLEKSILNLKLHPDPGYDQDYVTPAWGTQLDATHAQQSQVPMQVPSNQQHSHQYQLQQQQPIQTPPHLQQQQHHHYQQQQQPQHQQQLPSFKSQEPFSFGTTSIQTPAYFLLNNANTTGSLARDTVVYPRIHPYDVNQAATTPPTVIVGGTSSQWTAPGSHQANYSGTIGGFPTQLMASPAYSLMANPAVGPNVATIPATAQIQPQIAIVAADPATLRALLSGSLAPHNLFQPLLITQQPQPLLQPSVAQLPHDQQQQQQIQTLSLSQQQEQELQQQQQQQQTQPAAPKQQPQQPQKETQPSRQSEQHKQHQQRIKQQEVPTQSASHSNLGHLRVRNPSSGHYSSSFEQPEVDVSKTTCTTSEPIKSSERANKGSQKTSSVANEVQTVYNRSTEANTPQQSEPRPSVTAHPDVITRARHSTMMANGKSTLTKVQTKTQEDEEVNNVPRIGHPPRTVRKLAKPDLLESSSTSEELRHTTLREPRKLNVEAFLEQSRRRVSDVQNPMKSPDEAWGADDCDTIGRRREPISISAYYEKMKKERGTRPLSAYRPLTSVEQDRKEPVYMTRSDPKAGSTTRNVKPIGVEKRANPILRRAVTFAAESNENLPVLPHEGSDGIPHRTQRDPTIMSVAERARQWIEGRERELNDTHRYSTCGFIDQDLMDCQEIVPVEDRVKMFDSGSLSQRSTEEPAEESRTEVEKVSHVPVPERQTITPTAVRQETRLSAPTRTVASMRLRASKSPPSDTNFPRAAVGLQRIRMTKPGTSTTPAVPINLSQNGGQSSSPQTHGDELTRISRMRENSSNWRNRVQFNSFDEPIPSMESIRKSLVDSQKSWQKRVEEKDVDNFTVAGRLRNSPTSGSPEPPTASNDLEQAINCPKRLPAVPIVRATSKENRPSKFQTS